ncbi:cobyrinate a,c-diamide synthase [Bacillus sp. SCS-151]|uniref:cobyrinate a,c-diamide synthase n=1 Tax=Nanhaiella sioensis TaxID=3115293 RepID=UPI00397DE3F9
MSKRFVIAGTGSGVGKTTLTIGLMAAFQQRGLNVQGFKCGPDYIDPTYHTAVTGRPSRNLDSWMLSHEVVREIFSRGSDDADISIIEGVMGFYDGKNPQTNAGSTAEISVITNTPVILVVNCASMARSAAAIVKGFQVLSPEPNIVGVIANRVGSEGHYKLVKTAIEQECHIPVVGYLKREDNIEIPERHLGLVPSIERGELDHFFAILGNLVSETIDLDLLYELAESKGIDHHPTGIFDIQHTQSVKIAVAKDEAFNFYYQENLDILKAYGAELVFFSPLRGDHLPEGVSGLYIGGGFPEEFAKQLSEQAAVKDSIKRAITSGIPTLAECGGFMFLTDMIESTEDERFEMVGIIPGKVKMQQKLAALGYREISGAPGNYLLPNHLHAKGHEFHYSTFSSATNVQYAYETKGMRGVKKEGFMNSNVVAGYTHFHFASCPEMVHNWVTKCRQWEKDN